MNRTKRCKCFALLICSITTVACNHHRPPWPPPLDPSIYAGQVRSQLLSDTDLLTLDVAGVRIAKGGIYVDFVTHSKVVNERVRKYARTLGFFLSINREPEQYIQITDSKNRQVNLLPMRRPSLNFLSNSHTHYGDPPTYSLDDQRLIQVCMFRTTRQLKPGKYHVRFTDAWQSDTKMGGVWQPVSQQWRELSVDWAGDSN